MNEGTPLGVGYNKLYSFSIEDPVKRPLTFLMETEVGSRKLRMEGNVGPSQTRRKYVPNL
jgi:DNA phosphorothioation-dependent restriction protein DptG